MSRLSDIRDEVYARILLKKSLGNYSINEFGLEKTWRPFELLEELVEDHPVGKVYVIGMGWTEGQNKSRDNTALRDLPVQIAYQRGDIAPDDTSTIDSCVDLVEELIETCQNDVALAGYSWLNTELLLDENGTPFSFVMFRQANTFEAIWTAHYSSISQ
jgi:hypothetical protein